MNILQPYQVLNRQFGDEVTTAVSTLIDIKLKEQNDSNMKTLATKEDLKSVELKISESKAEVVRWIFGFFATTILVLIGLYLKK